MPLRISGVIEVIVEKNEGQLEAKVKGKMQRRERRKEKGGMRKEKREEKKESYSSYLYLDLLARGLCAGILDDVIVSQTSRLLELSLDKIRSLIVDCDLIMISDIGYLY